MSSVDPGFGPVLAKSQNLLASQRLTLQSRNLTQLINATRKLAQKPDPNAELNAHMFFASKGIDLSKHSSAMQQLRVAASQEIIEPAEDLDVDSFLEHQHEMLISSAVEECARINANAFHQHYVARLDDDWAAAKRDILESMNFQVRRPTALFPSNNYITMKSTLKSIFSKYQVNLYDFYTFNLFFIQNR